MDRNIYVIPTNGNTEIVNICLANGLLLIKREKNYHDEFTRAGIITSPNNSTRIYLNEYNDKYYIFNGWESDQFGRMVKKPRYVEMIDVTDIINQ
jgi:hypothetical protein